MLNPFIGGMYIESAEELYERGTQLNALSQFFHNRADAVLFGPEGSGKSVLLSCFFNHEFRIEMARKKTLIYQGGFPNNLSSEDTYGFFADSIRSSVEFLEVCGQTEQMSMLLRSLDAGKFDTKQFRFDQYLDKIRNFGYRMVIVLDNFENFTSSPNVKQEHHDLLCGMLNDHKLQLIVASNYDFNATSLPVGIHNSQLLTRLSPNNTHMTPLSINACQKLLDEMARSKNVDFRFTAQQVEVLHSISGGIPLLLQNAAENAFEVLQEACEDFEAEVLSRTLKEMLPILKHWCKVAPAEQLDLLHTLENKQVLSESEGVVASALKERGLLIDGSGKAQNNDKDTTVQPTAVQYTYNSGLFREFCRHKDWLDAVLKDNPLRKNDTPAEIFDPLSILKGATSASAGNGGVTIQIGNVENVTLQQGDTYHQQAETIIHNRPTVIADRGFERLFGILDLNSDDLGGKLLEIFNGTPVALPEGADREVLVEQTAERITSMFIPEEVETDDLEDCQEEQKTLEARFNAIRSQIDPQGMVDDELLASLSTKCRLYLQIAFVVDDALSALSDFHLGDLSAQMVMYGKVLEQQLKDNMYQLFRNDAVLKDIDVFTNAAVPESRSNFGFMRIQKTSIGNYMSIMRGQSLRLAELCSQNGVCFEGQSPNEQWWEQLGDDVDAARDLRNGGDHAGTETSQSDLIGMRQLLFGTGKLLRRCGTGGLLTRTLWPAAKRAAQPAVTTVSADKQALVGQIVDMTDIQITPRNSVRGTIAGTTYGVSISPKHLQERNCDPQDLVGQTIRVRIIQWDNNPASQKFNAELP